jgi:MoaA/NifB/PqqE/SkfB family radical SAM enzyme
MAVNIKKILAAVRQKGFFSTVKRICSHLADLPTSITLDLSVACNISCTICSLEQCETKGFMPWQVLHAMAVPLSRVPVIFLSCSGEPFLHPQFPAMVSFIRKAAPSAFIELHSNGVLLTDAIATTLIDNSINRLTISVDGSSRETFESIRCGALYEQVVNNIRSLTKNIRLANSTYPLLALRVVATKENINELTGLVRLAVTLGVHKLFVENLEPYSESLAGKVLYNGSKEAEKVFNEVRQLARDLGLDLEMPPLHSKAENSFCVSTAPVIFWDGTVRPCFALTYDRNVFLDGRPDRRRGLSLGNVLEMDFQTIWRSRTYREFRRKIKNRDFSGECSKCLVSKGVLFEK